MLSSLSYYRSNMIKRHFSQVLDPFHDVMEGPVHALLMVDNEDSTSSFATSDNNLFLSTFVDCSTDIRSSVAFLIHMLVLAGQGAPILFSTKFSMNRGLNSE